MRRTSESGTPARLIYGGLGWCAVGLAVTGLMVPGMPTTVFVLAASYCFSRSSPRFERWLRDNRWLGPSLQRFADAGGMTRSAKHAALTAMWAAILLSCSVLIGLHWAAAPIVVGLGVVGTLSILYGVRTVPEPPNPSPAGAAFETTSAPERPSLSVSVPRFKTGPLLH